MEDTFLNAKLYSELKNRNSAFLPKVEELYNHVDNVLPKINRVFSNYTGHGINHSIKVIDYMYDLIKDSSLLSDLEITILIYVALLHDIGMVVTDEEIEKIKRNDTKISERKYSLVYEKYKDETLTLQECIRPIHGKRSARYIDENVKEELFIIPNTTNISFKEEVKNICISHNESFEWLKLNLSQKEIKEKFTLNSQFISILLRLSDLLDIDESRTPLYLYKLLDPQGYGKTEWQQHFIIENKDKIIKNQQTGYKSIEFYGSSNNPKIHRKLLKYFDYINDELKNAISLSETFEEKYALLLKLNIDNKIQTKGFNFSDFKLNLDYNAVTNLLMGEHIYGDKKYGLRELIQNSIDACKLMLEISKTKQEFIFDEYRPYINIVVDKDKRLVSIIDNGVGMSLDILQKYFLNVGISYYSSDEYRFQGYDYTPIGNYGIGFLACFMLSDNVVVKTKRYEEIKLNEIELEKNSEYICLTYQDNAKPQGTEIILNFQQFLEVFNNGSEDVKKFVEHNFIECTIPIKVIEVVNGEFTPNTCNLTKMLDNSNKYARLDNYLNNIEGAIELYGNINFIEKLQDFDYNNSYVYDTHTQMLYSEDSIKSLSIKEFVVEDKVSYLQLPIISKYEAVRFDNALEVLADYDDALSRLNDVEFINIFCLDSDEYGEDNIIFKNEDIIDTYGFEDFCTKFSHDASVPTYRYLMKSFVVTANCESILQYHKNISITHRYSWNTSDKIYIKNVYIPNFHITIPYLLSGIQIKNGLFNIKNKSIVPNVSRNDVSKNISNDFSYAVGKALHLWILDNFLLSSNEEKLVQEFIKRYYSENNEYLK